MRDHPPPPATRLFAASAVVLAAAVLTVVTPVLIASAAPAPAAPARGAGITPAATVADRPTAALTVRTTTGLGRESRLYLILASGPPPASAQPLVDAAGGNPVQVSLVPTAACDSVPAHLTGTGTSPWCVQLDGVAAGTAVTGRLVGKGAVVTLTVQARHPWWLPAMVALEALLFALVVAWAAGTWLPSWVNRQLLARQESSDDGVDGLPDWARGADGRLATADVLARVRWAKRVGRAQVLAARADLRGALAGPMPTMPPCPLRTAAEAELARDDRVGVQDLLTPGGAVAMSRAEHLLELVEAAVAGLAAFADISARLVRDIVDPVDRTRAQELAGRAERSGLDYLSEFTLNAYLDHLRAVAAQLEGLVPGEVRAAAYAVTGTGGFAGVAMASVQRAGQPVSGRWPATDGRVVGAAAASAGRVVGEVVPVALLTAGLMSAAVIGVLIVQYLPNPTFGTGTDYLGLAATAFGSAQTAAALAVLLQLRGPVDWVG